MLPIKSILWAPTNSAHWNHLHVEGDPRFTGTPPPNNPGMSDSVWTIWVALAERFGRPVYFLDDDPGDWTHMGWYNRRKIAGTNVWSQHSWSNALDIGPYYGVVEQQRFYDFLTGNEPKEDPVSLLNISAASSPNDIRWYQHRLGISDSGDWDRATIDQTKALAVRANTGDEDALDGKHVNGRMWATLEVEYLRRVVGGGTVDSTARSIARHARDRVNDLVAHLKRS